MVVSPNGMPVMMYPAPIPLPRGNWVTVGIVAGTAMAVSADTLLTAHSPIPVPLHLVTVPTYQAQDHPPTAPCPSVVITLQMFEDGAVQAHHGGSTAGAANLTPPTRTFFLMLLTCS
ncbi:Myelin-associated neurite-outgrowth inhibitor [Camelus dromedarius]|uniref:Myelin-associated neurite-outgrowth inhibitor n=1 Tax=Camelus dromedarius TaxID=9838 RepID=A0A5N4DD59_CAMDR|nr:hypothetical protein CB1_002337043 [Camelus ferus]KAB1269071.1 Myelin-associated neurite-outgrowth inhibitor [Camelus dromedarius]